MLAAVAIVVGVAAQKGDKAEAQCPYCHEDPALMKAAGVLTHGPITVGDKGSEELERTLPVARWLYLETAHLRWASALGDSGIDQKDRERVEAELTRLRAALPDVPAKPKKLDPFLRLHLQAVL